MSYTVYWDDDAHTIIRWDLRAEMSVTEFRQADAQTHALAATIPHRFDLLIDGTGANVRSFPITEMQRAFRDASPKQNLTVIVSRNAFTRALVGVVQRMGLPITKRLVFVATVDEARAYIHARRAPL
jgi:hypothetical protein